jgi:glycosyltransferase involved in cell wall biosynthesis
MKHKRILFDALYINTGGAKVILETVVSELYNRGILSNYVFLIDIRLNSDIISSIDILNKRVINASVWSRKRFYIDNILEFDKVICLANLPPPVSIKDKPVYIFFHNAHILTPELGWRDFLGTALYVLKRAYILVKNKRQYTWIVQTDTMKKMVLKKLFVSQQKIMVIPFFKNIDFKAKKSLKIQDGDISFAYIADGQSQKNHKFLLEALHYLFKKHGLNVKLYLTISENYPSLIKKIHNLKELGISIINLGTIPHSEIINLYTKVDYLLYPSLVESFGLPLIEASSLGCDIISINKDYVYDIVVPSAVFSNKNIHELSNVLLNVYSGTQLPETKLVVKNDINEFLNLLI